MTDATARTTPVPVQPLLGFAFGAAFLLGGLAGFTVSDGFIFTARHGGKLLGIFLVNPLQNVLHIVLGGALLAAAFAGERAARVTILAAGTGCLLLGVLGLAVLHGSTNVLAVNQPGNVLHLVSGLVLLAAGLAAGRRPAPA